MELKESFAHAFPSGRNRWRRLLVPWRAIKERGDFSFTARRVDVVACSFLFLIEIGLFGRVVQEGAAALVES